MSRALDTMQAQIARVQLALDPPELVIEIPRDICKFYEFWRAKEVVRIGREVAEQALDKAGYWLCATALVGAASAASFCRWSREWGMRGIGNDRARSDAHTSELQSIMRNTYAVI